MPHIGDIGLGLLAAAAVFILFGLAASILGVRANDDPPGGATYPVANWPVAEERQAAQRLAARVETAGASSDLRPWWRAG